MSLCPPGQTSAGHTTHFQVCYDPTLANGAALAAALLARCEQDLSSLATFWSGTAVPSGIEVSIVPGPGGAFHSGTITTEYATPTSDAPGMQALLVAEVAEMFMSNQEAALGRGFSPGYSHGEGLSRVMAAELYPAIAGRFASALGWLNTSRPDWVSNTETTDQDGVSYGCAALFLNYLRHQLDFSWAQIIAAADNTLALVAQNLGLQNAYGDFYALLAYHYPVGTNVSPTQLPHDPEGPTFYIDNLFPLASPPPQRPNPCQAEIDALEDLSSGDFPATPAGRAMYARARTYLMGQLRACEERHHVGHHS